MTKVEDASKKPAFELELTRVIDAPRERVWKAWTDPEQLMRWWAPNGCTTPACTVDLRQGGRFHYCMRMPDGKDIWGLGIYREIVALERIVYVDSFADASGNPVPPTHYGMSEDHPAETLVIVTFVEQGAKTKVTVRHAIPEAIKERKDTEQGWIQMLDRLAEHLANGPVILERTFDASIEAMWSAITDYAKMKQWYMKDLVSFEPRVGFETEFTVHHGGKDFPHQWQVTEVVPGKKIAYRWTYVGNPGESFVSFELFPEGKRTTLRLTHTGLHTFDPERNPDLARENFVEGWTSLIGESLEKFLGKSATTPAFELELTRLIAAPRERVYEAWTRPEPMAQWFAPKPYTLIIHGMDFRPSGKFSMAMRGPNGEDFPFTGTYREIIPPAKLHWTGEFASGPADQMTTVVTFEEQGQQTKVHARQTFHVMTPEIEHATKGAQQGWTITLDQLAEFCA